MEWVRWNAADASRQGLLGGLATGHGKCAVPALGKGKIPLCYHQVTSLSISSALTVPTACTTAVISAETQAVRHRDD